MAPVVRIGATMRRPGALLALIAGVGRTTLAMARHRDLPSWLAAVHPRYHVPHHAELALAVTVSVLVLITDLRGVIGFSSFGVLIYYAIANAAAFTQPPTQAALAARTADPWRRRLPGSRRNPSLDISAHRQRCPDLRPRRPRSSQAIRSQDP